MLSSIIKTIMTFSSTDQENTPGLTKTALLTPVSSSLSEPLTSGFGSVIEEEHELQTLLRECTRTATGIHGDNIARIFINHLQEIDEILALLYERSDRLPHPLRFTVLKSGLPLPTHARPLSSFAQPLFGRLVAFHLHLQGGIEKLLIKEPELGGEKQLLKQIAQRHEDMAWMLNALIKEDAPGGDPDILRVVDADASASAAQSPQP